MVSLILFIGILIASVLFLVLPGFLVWRLFKDSPIIDSSYFVSIGIGFSMVLALFVGTASILRYDLVLMLSEYVLLVLALLILLHRSQRLSFRFPFRKIKRRHKTFVLYLFFIFIFMVLPVFAMVVPFDTDAQGFGFYALTVREGGTVNTLSPYFPDVKYLYSPGYFVLVAFFSDVLGKAPIHEVMMSFSHLCAFFLILSIFALGRSIGGMRFGILMSVCAMLGTGILSHLYDSHYTVILGLIFLATFLLFFFKSLREPSLATTLFASLSLGSVCLSHPDTLINILIVFIPFYLVIFLSKERILRKNYLVSFLLIPLLGVIVALPWLLLVLKMFFMSSIQSAFASLLPSFKNAVYFIIFQGVLMPIFAFIGLYFAAKRRRFEDVFAVLWFVVMVEFSMLGIVEWLGRNLSFDITVFMWPGGVAWQGPIIPFAYFAALFVTSAIMVRKELSSFIISIQKPVLYFAMILTVLLVIFSGPIVVASKALHIPFFGAFSTEADLDAMLWLKYNTPKDSIILNYPSYYEGVRSKFEGQWVPIVAERKPIVTRYQGFFVGFEDQFQLIKDYGKLYLNPDEDKLKDMISEDGVSYIILPQVSTNRSAFITAQSWYDLDIVDMSPYYDSYAWLEKVYDNNGAMIYKVRHTDR